ERLFAIAQRIPFESGRINAMQSLALNAFARSKPSEASRIATGMPPGAARDQVVQAVTNALGRQDPAAAIAWVKSLSPPSRDAQLALVQSVAVVDLDRALALVTELDPAGQDPILHDLAFSMVFSSLSIGEEKLEAAAVRLAERNDPPAKRALTSLVQAWAS